jgi:hypothetical protein
MEVLHDPALQHLERVWTTVIIRELRIKSHVREGILYSSSAGAAYIRLTFWQTAIISSGKTVFKN